MGAEARKATDAVTCSTAWPSLVIISELTAYLPEARSDGAAFGTGLCVQFGLFLYRAVVEGVGWEMSDAWVFAAIGGLGPDDGDTLSQVIARGDGINHAILSEAEFVRAVPRLINAGLIDGDRLADRYWRTQAGHALYERRMKRRGLFGWIEAIPPALRRLGHPDDGDWTLDAGVYERALRDYRDSWAQD